LNAASDKTEKESSLLGYQGGNSFYIPVQGDKISPTDYSDINNWIALPKKRRIER
jgi:hypothetical protein